MSSIVSIVPLIARATNAPVDAELRHPIETSNVTHWETQWRPMIEATVARLKAANVPRQNWPQDVHWDWKKKADAMRGLLSFETFCIEHEGVTQGMMALNVARRAQIKQQAGQHLVYVEYLETAPWNRREHQADPRFRGVGSALILAAIALSRHEGFKGRIGLHSLPQADDFYTRILGMTDLGPDTKYQNLRYFEMTTDQADKLAPP
jgi:hypothetical protein